MKGMRAKLMVLFVITATAASTQVARSNEVMIYANCSSRFAAMFPAKPSSRVTSYDGAGGIHFPAYEYYLDTGLRKFSVLSVEFDAGPEADMAVVDYAANSLRNGGRVQVDVQNDYEPGMPGRQLSIIEPNGAVARVAIYMAKHRLYILKAVAPSNDLSALQLEESLTLIDQSGVDLATKPTTKTVRRFNCD